MFCGESKLGALKFEIIVVGNGIVLFEWRLLVVLRQNTRKFHRNVKFLFSFYFVFVPPIVFIRLVFFDKFSEKGHYSYLLRNIKWSGNFSEGALCEKSQSLWHTHETQGPSRSTARSHMPQLLTVFPLRLSSTDPQKCDFCKSHSRRGIASGPLSLAHSWDTGPKQKHRALSCATTPYGFPIKTIQYWPSEMWLLQIAFSTGIASGPLSLAHSWDTGPKQKHRALSCATTLYGFLIKTIQYWPSEIWLQRDICNCVLMVFSCE